MALIKRKKKKKLFYSVLLCHAIQCPLRAHLTPSRPACSPDFVGKLKGKLVALIPCLVLCMTDLISLPHLPGLISCNFDLCHYLHRRYNRSAPPREQQPVNINKEAFVSY